MASCSFLCLFALVLCSHATADSSSDLSPCYYDEVCPEALPTITRVVNNTVEKEKRMGASLLRLHFHDCFVNGCDASILLDNTTTIFSEKLAIPNRNSARGFDVIDKIKYEVDKVCQGPVVSCADILAVAARDSVVKLGGPTWTVELGRRDSTNASKTDAEKDIPNPSMDLLALIDSFRKQGLDTKDLVALSGAHTIGFSQCATFRKRIYNDSNIDPIFARDRQSTCPPNGNDTNLAPLDPTAATFDTRYFANLVKKRGLLHSDQALFSGAGGATDSLVKTYSTSFGAFSDDFVESMVKMGNIKPLTGKKGQIRVNCRKVN